MPSLDPVLTGDTMCQCGRIAAKIHCPACGSYNHYAVKQKSQRLNATGGVDEYTVHRCRGCGIYYDEWQWRNDCKANQYISSRRRKIDQAVNVVADTIADMNPIERASLEAARDPNAPRDQRIAGFAALFKNVIKTRKEDQ